MLHKLVSATFLLLGFSSLAVADELPNPGQVYIKSISHGGSGCPQGSVGSYVSEDGCLHFHLTHSPRHSIAAATPRKLANFATSPSI